MSDIIQVVELSKTFGDIRAVDGVSFTVGAREIFGFLGPNGAGKSTTIKMLATLLKPTGGRATLAGYDVATQPTEVRQSIGLVFQDQSLDNRLTADENLKFHAMLYDVPGDVYRERADQVLKMVDLLDRRSSIVMTYSGGMKRRLDLASALMHQPPLLILDEPTEGLDPQSRTALWEELERIGAQGTTMLLTTHYMEEADRLCSRLAIVDNGRIVVEGAPQELKETVGADSVVLQLESTDGTGIARGVAGSDASGDGEGDGIDRDGAGKSGEGDGIDRVGAVCRRLEGLVPCEAVAAHPAGVVLSVPNAGAAVPQLMRRIDGDGLRITGLQMTRPSLDDVFLKYTGRHIREEAADQPIIMGW